MLNSNKFNMNNYDRSIMYKILPFFPFPSDLSTWPLLGDRVTYNA
jgi:hypothetical protein